MGVWAFGPVGPDGLEGVNCGHIFRQAVPVSFCTCLHVCVNVKVALDQLFFVILGHRLLFPIPTTAQQPKDQPDKLLT